MGVRENMIYWYVGCERKRETREKVIDWCVVKRKMILNFFSQKFQPNKFLKLFYQKLSLKRQTKQSHYRRRTCAIFINIIYYSQHIKQPTNNIKEEHVQSISA